VILAECRRYVSENTVFSRFLESVVETMVWEIWGEEVNSYVFIIRAI
jgi:hypothetical protein